MGLYNLKKVMRRDIIRITKLRYSHVYRNSYNTRIRRHPSILDVCLMNWQKRIHGRQKEVLHTVYNQPVEFIPTAYGDGQYGRWLQKDGILENTFPSIINNCKFTSILLKIMKGNFLISYLNCWAIYTSLTSGL